MNKTNFFKALATIIEYKQIELHNMCRFNQENTIGYCIISDELKDAERILEAKNLSDAELLSVVKDVNSKTTSSNIMVACEVFINSTL